MDDLYHLIENEDESGIKIIELMFEHDKLSKVAIAKLLIDDGLIDKHCARKILIPYLYKKLTSDRVYTKREAREKLAAYFNISIGSIERILYSKKKKENNNNLNSDAVD